jgi:hypothetical protein
VTKPFNLVLVHPPGYTHALALAEAVEYLRAELARLGHEVRESRGGVDPGATNVVFCGHLLAESAAARLPADSIVFNSEQLADAAGWHFASGVYRRLLARHRVWDYSPVNLPHVGHDRTSVIPFLYCAELVRPRLTRAPGSSLLFYGVLTPYRRRVLEQLSARGVAVDVVNAFGPLRDAWMVRARAVLNLHKTDDRRMFEPVRCFYPLINGVPVISEATTDPAADPYRESMLFADDLESLASATPRDPAPFRSTTASAAIRCAVEAFLHEQAASHTA